MATKVPKRRKSHRGVKQADGKRSKTESLVAGLIRALRFRYEGEHFDYVLAKKYVPDFIKGDRVLEVKGYFPGEERTKMRRVVEQYPNYRFLMIFTNPDKTITKASKTTYGEWCTKNGIEWCSLEQFKREYKKLCR